MKESISVTSDLEDINDIVNILSLYNSRPNETLHRDIYEILSCHLNLSVTRPATNYLLPFVSDTRPARRHMSTQSKKVLTNQLVSVSEWLRIEPDVVREFRRLNRVYHEHHREEPSKSHQDAHMFIAMLNHLTSDSSSVLLHERLKYQLYGYRPLETRGVDIESSKISRPVPTNIHDGTLLRIERSSHVSIESPLRYFVPLQTLTTTHLSSIIEVALVEDISETGELKYWRDSVTTMVAKISKDRCLQNEINVYEALREIRADVPEIITDFYFLGNPVLLMERLNPITPTLKILPDIVRSIARQLKMLHQIGVHCDIKPSNLMMSDDSRYFLIDYGGTVLVREAKGAPVESDTKRFTYTSMFSSQRTTSKEVSIKNDLIEFVYTINHMYHSCKARGGSPDRFRYEFEGKYEKLWRLVCEYTSDQSDIYDKIDRIFSG